jgi:flagellar motor switch protein FliN/FliY
MADEKIGQDEIEEMLRQAQTGNTPEAPKEEVAAVPDASLGQDEIEALLNGGGAPAAAAPAPTPAPAPVAAAPVAAAAAPPRPLAQGGDSESGIGQDDIELLLNQAEAALASVDQPTEVSPPGIIPFALGAFGGTEASSEKATLELINDVELDLKIELGRTQMYLEDVLRLRKGAVVPLDKLAGDPVDIYVNGRLIARGEVLVLNDNFCVRVAELLSGNTVASAAS